MLVGGRVRSTQLHIRGNLLLVTGFSWCMCHCMVQCTASVGLNVVSRLVEDMKEQGV